MTKKQNIKKTTEQSRQVDAIVIPQDVKAENIKQCNYCGGIIDRYEYLFKCRECGSFGDLTTGIMEPPIVLNR